MANPHRSLGSCQKVRTNCMLTVQRLADDLAKTVIHTAGMSIRDELNELIAVERQNLRERDRRDEQQFEPHRQQLAELRAALNEIVDTVDPKFIEAQFEDYWARITIGWEGTRRCKEMGKIQWDITPLIENDALDIAVKEKKTGDEFTRLFNSVRHLTNYILPRIAGRVAHYQHYEDKIKQ